MTENQQKIDAEHILTLQNEKGELTDRVKELEAQIEKMKCCENCVHHCEMLKTIHDLNERNKILEAQIEKMRNFQNCDYQLHVTDCPIFKSGGHISCKKCPYWILQEIKEK